ncbi:9407_t:CDS:2 [Funneliformis geosporum]|nr:9407_t:CDS:2 [Funneliformis geosporum]
MQQQNGLSIILYSSLSTKKRLQFHTWTTNYFYKQHNRSLIKNKDDNIKEAWYDGFAKVPHEIMINIMDNLEVNDVLSLSMVNRKLRAHTHDNYLWRQILLSQYGEIAIQNHQDRLLINNHRKGKWKRTKNKQISSVPDWKKVYMRLSTVKVKTKTAFSRGRPGTFYRYRYFDHKENEPSNRMKQKQRSFNIEITISNVPPGIYDIIWRMKIDKSTERPIVNFSTDIWLRHDIYLNSYEREAKYKYSPDPEELVKVFDKGWFHFRLPYQIEISKIENSEDRRYQVHTGIKCYTENITKSSSVKGPFSVEYVCLRPHIPYDDCPINNNENSSAVQNNSSCINSVNGCEMNTKRNSFGNLKKNKRLSKILCVA